MSAHPTQSELRTADEFLCWANGREGRYEFVQGQVVRVPDRTRCHAELSASVAAALFPAAQRMGLGIVSGWSLRTRAGIRAPDVMIFRPTGDGGERAACEPVFVAEILSKPALADISEKVAEYTAIDSLRHYLVLAQGEPRVWLWSRDGKGRFGLAETIAGSGEVVALPGLDSSLPLAEFHRGIA